VASVAIDSRSATAGSFRRPSRRARGRPRVRRRSRCERLAAALVERRVDRLPCVEVQDTAGPALAGARRAASDRRCDRGRDHRGQREDVDEGPGRSRAGIAVQTHASPASFNTRSAAPDAARCVRGTEVVVRRWCETARRRDAPLRDRESERRRRHQRRVAHMESSGPGTRSWRRPPNRCSRWTRTTSRSSTRTIPSCAGMRQDGGTRPVVRARCRADVRAGSIVLGDDARASFVLAVDGTREHVELACQGAHGAERARRRRLRPGARGLARECAVALKGARVSASRMRPSPRGGRARRERCLQREPRVDGRGLKAARWMAREGHSPRSWPHGRARPISLDEHEKLGS